MSIKKRNIEYLSAEVLTSFKDHPFHIREKYINNPPDGMTIKRHPYISSVQYLCLGAIEPLTV